MTASRYSRVPNACPDAPRAGPGPGLLQAGDSGGGRPLHPRGSERVSSARPRPPPPAFFLLPFPGPRHAEGSTRAASFLEKGPTGSGSFRQPPHPPAGHVGPPAQRLSSNCSAQRPQVAPDSAVPARRQSPPPEPRGRLASPAPGKPPPRRRRHRGPSPQSSPVPLARARAICCPPISHLGRHGGASPADARGPRRKRERAEPHAKREREQQPGPRAHGERWRWRQRLGRHLSLGDRWLDSRAAAPARSRLGWGGW